MSSVPNPEREFTVRCRQLQREFVVCASSHGEAAKRAARLLYPDAPRYLRVHRTTGDMDNSGQFQAYQWVKGANAWSSYGEPFHVV